MLCALVVALAPRCSSDYNPFADSANVAVEVIARDGSLSDNDTVLLYSTRQLILAPLTIDLLESFSVESPGALYSKALEIDHPANQEYTFSVAWSDTGRQSIVIRVLRHGGDWINRTVHVYVRSPLSQNDIDTTTDREVTLSTTAVDDSVWYHWALSGPFPDTIHSQASSYTTLFESPGVYTGTLWVSRDPAGTDRPSPGVPFTLTLTDRIGPYLSLVGQNSSSDTIVSSQPDFTMQLYAVDGSGIRELTINSEEFEFSSPPYYSTAIRNLDSYTRLSPYEATIRAQDRNGFLTLKRYYLYYDPSAASSGLTELTIGGSIDTVRTDRPQYLLVGHITDYYRSVVSITAVVDGGSAGESRLVTLREGQGYWALNATLVQGTNTVTVQASDTAGTLLAQQPVTIIRTQSVSDTTAPTLLQCLIGSESAVNGQSVQVAETTALMSLVTADESGIATVTVNGQEIAESVNHENYRWETMLGPFDHVTPYLVVLVITDSRGNSLVARFLVYRNTTPSFSSLMDWPARFFANITREIPLWVHDDDQVELRLDSAPESMTARRGTQYNAWRIDFTPTLADTGRHEVTVILDDGSGTVKTQWSFIVLADSSELVSLATPPAAVPSIAEVGKLFQCNLTIKDSSGLPPFQFVIDLDASTTPMLDSSTTERSLRLDWVPSFPDTGRHLFRTIVRDDRGDADTLLRIIRVMYTNSLPVHILRTLPASAVLSAANTLDMRSSLEPVTISYTIIDDDEPQTERYTATVTAKETESSLIVDSTRTFSVIVPTYSVHEYDTVIVRVTDRTNTTALDTLYVRYALPLGFAGPFPTAADDTNAGITIRMIPPRSTLALGGSGW